MYDCHFKASQQTSAIEKDQNGVQGVAGSNPAVPTSFSIELTGHREAASEARLGDFAGAVSVGLVGRGEKTITLSLTCAFAALAITAYIIRQMGRVLACGSEPNAGIWFWVGD